MKAIAIRCVDKSKRAQPKREVTRAIETFRHFCVLMTMSGSVCVCNVFAAHRNDISRTSAIKCVSEF